MSENKSYVKNEPASGKLKCHRCAVCDGYGCPDMLPGLGGVFEGKNFQLNYEGWRVLFNKASELGKAEEIRKISVRPEQLRCGPVTGAVENIGYEFERDFYFPYLMNAAQAGLGLCVGDGYPDTKLKFGVEALQKINEAAAAGGTESSADLHKFTENSKIAAAFFLKPYPQERLFERVEWVRPFASHIGIDIDSYNIVTMRNLVNLERKTAAQLQEFREHTKLPFVIKGVFTDEDLNLVRLVRPEVVYISNHGGRVETRIGSTAQFLAENAAELKNYCQEIWVDGGIRTHQDVQTALYYGADKIIMARPLIRATFDSHYQETIKEFIEK